MRAVAIAVDRADAGGIDVAGREVSRRLDSARVAAVEDHARVDDRDRHAGAGHAGRSGRQVLDRQQGPVADRSVFSGSHAPAVGVVLPQHPTVVGLSIRPRLHGRGQTRTRKRARG